MKTIFKSTIIASALLFMLMADMPLFLEQHVPPLFDQLVPEAHAILGVRRRTRRRTAVVVGSAAYATTTSAQQQAEAAKQQAAAPLPPAAAAGKPLPMGTVVATLPGGCTSTPVGGKEYYYCGGNFYQAVFQGNQLMYVTAKPE